MAGGEIRQSGKPSRPKNGRSRLVYGLLTVVVLVGGLWSRRIPDGLPFIRDSVGDGLWALLVYSGLAVLFNRWSSGALALTALLFSCSIEVSQLYHAPWIDSLRATRLGGLVLGYSFVWSDLICYSVGIRVGLWIDRRLGAATTPARQ